MESHRRQQQRSKRLPKPKRRAAASALRRVMVFSPSTTGDQPGGCAPINFGDFDEKGWARFKHELLRLMDASIRDGRWRQVSREASGGIAMSCPRF